MVQQRTSHNTSTYSMDLAASEPGVDATEAFNKISLTHLSADTRHLLSYNLNNKKIIRSEEGYERDWRGIAFLSGQKPLCDEQALSSANAMDSVLRLWCANNRGTATFGNLNKYLGYIDRWDVCDDISESLALDAKRYNEQLQQTSTAIEVPEFDTNYTNSNAAIQNIVTLDDYRRHCKGLSKQRFDAYVLFAESDYKFVEELLYNLERKENFKLFLEQRDLLPGHIFTHLVLTQLIDNQCNHLIVVLTESFLKSNANTFLVNYTQAQQIENQTRKIIPIIYDESVIIPKTLKIYTHLKFRANSGLFNFWDLLAASLRIYTVPMATEVPAVCDVNALPNVPTEPPMSPDICNGNTDECEFDDNIPTIINSTKKKAVQCNVEHTKPLTSSGQKHWYEKIFHKKKSRQQKT